MKPNLKTIIIWVKSSVRWIKHTNATKTKWSVSFDTYRQCPF